MLLHMIHPSISLQSNTFCSMCIDCPTHEPTRMSIHSYKYTNIASISSVRCVQGTGGLKYHPKHFENSITGQILIQTIYSFNGSVVKQRENCSENLASFSKKCTAKRKNERNSKIQKAEWAGVLEKAIQKNFMNERWRQLHCNIQALTNIYQYNSFVYHHFENALQTKW